MSRMSSFLRGCLVVLLAHALVLKGETLVTNVAAGYNFSLFIRADGSLWGTGESDFGQLGPNVVGYPYYGIRRPALILPAEVVALAGGAAHTLFIKTDGTLWTTGYNNHGQLGYGDQTVLMSSQPRAVTSNGVLKVATLACTCEHSLFITADGSLWGMGLNSFGQLGDGTWNDAYSPVQIASTGVSAAAGGAFHSLFIKSDGSLWAMGEQSYGQLGDGTYGGPYKPATNLAERVVSSGVVAVAAGSFHSLFLKDDGSLWGMGDNSHGQLGIRTLPSNVPDQIVPSGVVAVGAGDYQSVFLKADGSLWSLGATFFGDGTWGDTNRPACIVPGGVTAFAVGAHCVLFLKNDSSLWGLGLNTYGGLGDGFTNTVSRFPEQIIPSPQPVLIVSVSSRTNLELKAICQYGGTYMLLAGTNIVQPAGEWTPIYTNFVTTRGTPNLECTLTNSLGAGIGAQLFRLQGD